MTVTSSSWSDLAVPTFSMSTIVWWTVLCLVDPRARTVDVSGGVTTETRAGVAPIAADAPSEPAFVAIVTPNVDLLVRSRRHGSLLLGYSPRMQLRLPNRLDVKRPIFLQQMYFDYRKALSRRLLLDVGAGASVGEIDYTTAAQFIGDAQQLPDRAELNAITQYAVAEGGVRLEGIVAPRHVLVIEPVVGHRTPIGVDVSQAIETGVRPLPTQTYGTLGLTYAFAVSPVDDVGITARPGLVDYEGRTTYVSSDARVQWERRLDLELTSRLEAGVFAAHTLRSDPRLVVDDTKVFPVGLASIRGRLWSRSSHWVDGVGLLGVTGYFDRLREEVDPRGQAQAGFIVTFPPRWVVAVNASMYTPLTTEFRISPVDGRSDEESVFNLQTPITYLIDQRMAVEVGTVFSYRASNFTAPDFHFDQFEGWFYVAFRISGGTIRGGGEVVEDPSQQIGVGTRGIGLRTGGRRGY